MPGGFFGGTSLSGFPLTLLGERPLIFRVDARQLLGFTRLAFCLRREVCATRGFFRLDPALIRVPDPEREGRDRRKPHRCPSACAPPAALLVAALQDI